MQLDRELIDVSGHFGALRFVFLQLARIWLFRLRNECLLSAFLTRQIHAGGRSVRDQRRFAMLAVKENIGIGFDFADRIHGQ